MPRHSATAPSRSAGTTQSRASNAAPGPSVERLLALRGAVEADATLPLEVQHALVERALEEHRLEQPHAQALGQLGQRVTASTPSSSTSGEEPERADLVRVRRVGRFALRPGATDLRVLEEHQAGRLEEADHLVHEARRGGAVHDPVVEGDGEVRHLADDDLAVPTTGRSLIL